MASPLVQPVCLLTNEMNLADLEAVQAHIISRIESLPPKEKLLTKSELLQEIIKIDTRLAFKSSWKTHVTNSKLVENVFRFLDDCYTCDCPRRTTSNESFFMAVLALGGPDTLKWQNFKVRVIKYLHTNGSFVNGSGGWNDYGGPEGGYYDITLNAAIYIMENPEWSRGY